MLKQTIKNNSQTELERETNAGQSGSGSSCFDLEVQKCFHAVTFSSNHPNIQPQTETYAHSGR